MKKKVILSILFIVFLGNVIPSQVSWEPAKRLTWKNGYIYHLNISSFWKFVHVIWTEGQSSTYALYYKRSTDYGTTWLQPVRLSWSGYLPDDIDMVVNGKDVHIVYFDYAGLFHLMSTDNGSTWKRTRLPTFLWPMSIAIAVRDNTIHLGMGGFFKNDVYYRRSTDNGITWEPIKRITWNAGRVKDVGISVSGDNVHLTYVDDFRFYGHFDLYYKKSTDNGVTWIGRRQIASPEKQKIIDGYDDPKSVTSVSISSYDSHINIFYAVQWLPILMRYSCDDGESWRQADYIGGTIISIVHPRASVTYKTDAYLVYKSIGYSDLYFQESSDSGINWEPSQRITWIDRITEPPPSLCFSPAKGYLYVLAPRWVDYVSHEVLIFKRGKLQ